MVHLFEVRLLFEFKAYFEMEPKAVLCIAGPGQLESFVEQSKENAKYLQKVHQFGILNGEALNRFYNCADVFLLTSRYEGMPICVLEALAVGVPVVSVVVGSIKILLQNGVNGFIVESRNQKEIADAIKMATDLNSSLSANSRESVHNFSSAKVISDLVSIQLNSNVS